MSLRQISRSLQAIQQTNTASEQGNSQAGMHCCRQAGGKQGQADVPLPAVRPRWLAVCRYRAACVLRHDCNAGL